MSSATRSPTPDKARWMRGIALTVPAALLGLAAAVRLDAWLDLAGWARALLVFGWFGLVVLAGWGWSAAPPRPLRRVSATAFAAVLALMSVALVPAAGERVRRLFLPFYTPIPATPFRLVVSSGNPVVKRGEPVTLTAYAEPLRPDVPLPEVAWLLVRPRFEAAEQRLPMTTTGVAAFRYTRAAVEANFQYAVEADGLRSEWHDVSAAELAAFTTVTLDIEPPEYARPTRPTEQIVLTPSVESFAALQFSRAIVTATFTRPPVEAFAEWKPDTGAGGMAMFRLASDRHSGTFTLPLDGPGTVKFVLVGEKNLRTEFTVRAAVTPDRPPGFDTATGLGDRPREVRPDGVILGEVAARDDVAVAGLWLDVRVNNGPVISEALPATGGSFAWPLTGRAKDGDTVHLRARTADGRSLPYQSLAPQETTFPVGGWTEFRVTTTARPLIEQEVFAQRDRARQALTAAAETVAGAAKIVQAVAVETAGKPASTVDQTVRLGAAREQVSDARKELERYAAEARLVPDLRPLADAIVRMANGPLHDAATELSRGNTTTKLNEVADTLTRLATMTEPAAAARLDRFAILQLASSQRSLADRPAGERLRGQRDLRARLSELLATGPTLTAAAAAAEADARRELAERTATLAADHRTLCDAIAATFAAARDRQFAELAKQQTAFALEIAAFGKRIETPARLARAQVPLPHPAADRLAANRPDQALLEMEKSANEWVSLADQLAAVAAARADAKEAARQLARWQADLRQRRLDAGSPSPEFTAEQRAIAATFDRLKLSRRDDLDRLRSEAARAVATEPSQVSVEALNRLAEAIPTRERRLLDARGKVDALRNEQSVLTRTANEAMVKKALPDKANELADKQDTLAVTIEAIDAPGLGHRLTAAAAAARRAAADLRAGFATDIPVSQQAVRRQLDRLRAATEGTTPNDEAAAELARLQRDLAEAVERLPMNAEEEKLRPVRLLQRELLRQINTLKAPESPTRLADARTAADTAARSADVATLRTATHAAAEAFTRLADHLTGAESDLRRIETLARERAAAVERARLAPRTPPTPEEAAETARLLQRVADDLEQTRVGAAQVAKKKAVDAVAKLRAATDADRRPELQQAAADALRQLAEQMKKNSDRATGSPLPPREPVVDPATGPGLPTAADAEAARALARKQRALRDAVAHAAADLSHGVRPAATDPLGELAEDEAKLVVEMKPFHEVARYARSAADALREGRPADAKSAMIEAAQLMRAVDGGAKWATRQTELTAKLTDAMIADFSFAAARQRNELTALADRAAALAIQLEDAATRRGAAGPTDPFRDVAAALRSTRAELLQAVREADAGRAATARQHAAERLMEAVEIVRSAAPMAPAAPADGRAALAILRQAGERMRIAEVELTKPKSTADLMLRGIADLLNEAAELLAPAARGVGESQLERRQ